MSSRPELWYADFTLVTATQTGRWYRFAHSEERRSRPAVWVSCDQEGEDRGRRTNSSQMDG